MIRWYRLLKQKSAARVVFPLLILIVASIWFELLQYLLSRTYITGATAAIYTPGSTPDQLSVSQTTNLEVYQLSENTNVTIKRTLEDSIDHSQIVSSSSFATTSLPQIPWLEAYVKWHAHSLEYKTKSTDDGPNQYLIWQCYPRGRCGGLGDRLNGIIQAFFMAICSNRVFIIDHGSFQNKKGADKTNWLDALLPHRISWNRTDVLSTTQSIFELRTTSNVPKLTPYTSFPHLLENYTNVVLHNNVYLGDNYWSASTSCLWKNSDRNGFDTLNNHTYTLFRTAFYTLFQWNPRVTEHAHLLLQQSGIIESSTTTLPSLKNNYIGWHVRTGSGKTWKDPPRIKALADKTVDSNNVDGSEVWATPMLQCAQRVQSAYEIRCNHSYIKNNSSVFYNTSVVNSDDSLPLVYLATDKDEVKDFIAQDKTASATIRYAADLEIMHVDRSRLKKFADANKAMWNMWSELYILINADCLVTSRSTFSGLAIRLGKQRDHLQESRCSVYWERCNERVVTAAMRYAFC